MDIHLQEWASLVFRWAHIVAGVAWIGTSFYFMALDFALRPREGQPDGVKGENWQVHGGGFYHIQKYMVAPESMPGDLKWFRWESYLTWLTGFALLAVVYYWQADIYLIDRSVMALSKPLAIGISIGALVASWLAYDALCKSPLKDRQVAMFAVLFVLIVGASYVLGQVFSPRAAFLHVGAMIATIMTGNVFFVIIPNQKIVVADLLAGKTPDPKFGVIAKLRSTHNNYLTLPVIFLMISNHYPMTYGHPMNWVVIAFILPIGAIVRDYFNAHDRGVHGMGVRWQWPTAMALLLLLMIFVAWRPTVASVDTPSETAAEETSHSDGDNAAAIAAFAIIERRCTICHAANPTDFVAAPPAGVLLETPQQIKQYADKIYDQSIATKIMPPGNLTEMTDDERQQLGAWIATLSDE